MDHKSTLRHFALAAFVALAGVQAAQAQALSDNAASDAVVAQPSTTTALPSTGGVQLPGQSAAQPAGAAALTPAEAQQSAAGNVAELQQMIRGSDLTELRTTYNGTYGASLLFYGKEMTYYVALFQDKHLWRVIRSQEKTRAEMVYANFVQQTVQLADIEIRRTELEAQKAFLERVIALQANRAQQLQADLSVARSQQAEVAQRQRSAQEQAQALQVEKRAAQMQLRDLQEQVRQLEKQTETGLPAHK